MNPDVKTIKQLLKELTLQIREEKQIRKSCARMTSKYWLERASLGVWDVNGWSAHTATVVKFRDEASAKHAHACAAMKFTALCMLRSAMRGRIHWANHHKTQAQQISSIVSTLAYDAERRIYKNWRPIFTLEEQELIQRVLRSIDAATMQKTSAVASVTSTSASPT